MRGLLFTGCLLTLSVSTSLFGWTHVGLNISGWSNSRLAVDFNASNCSMAETELTAIIDQAITAWNGVASSSMTLSRNVTTSVIDRTDFNADTLTAPVIICETNFAVANQADADSVPAATTVSVDSQGRINGAIISLNSEAGTGAEISGLSEDVLVIVLAHELGHALGLGHSSQTDALMYYSVANKTEAVLALDDIDGLTFLYPRNEFGASAFGCAAVHGARSPKSLWWVVIFLAIVLPAGRAIYFRPGRLPVPQE